MPHPSSDWTSSRFDSDQIFFGLDLIFIKIKVQVSSIGNGVCDCMWEVLQYIQPDAIMVGRVFDLRDFKSGIPWGGISSDDKNGIVYLTTGNPKPYYVGVRRPGKNLYSNSIIAFDIRNKKILWHFQETCHDIWNFDIAAPPILTTINKKKIHLICAICNYTSCFSRSHYHKVNFFFSEKFFYLFIISKI